MEIAQKDRPIEISLVVYIRIDVGYKKRERLKKKKKKLLKSF